MTPCPPCIPCSVKLVCSSPRHQRAGSAGPAEPGPAHSARCAGRGRPIPAARHDGPGFPGAPGAGGPPSLGLLVPSLSSRPVAGVTCETPPAAARHPPLPPAARPGGGLPWSPPRPAAARSPDQIPPAHATAAPAPADPRPAPAAGPGRRARPAPQHPAATPPSSAVTHTSASARTPPRPASRETPAAAASRSPRSAPQGRSRRTRRPASRRATTSPEHPRPTAATVAAGRRQAHAPHPDHCRGPHRAPWASSSRRCPVTSSGASIDQKCPASM